MNRTDGPSNTAAVTGGRPRARTMVRIDLENAYARLGVSPLMPTDEIKEVINRRRKEMMRRRRTRGEQRFGEEEDEMTRLQAIEDEIGTPKARARYDRLNPQNALLTIQPSPGDVGLDARNRAGLVTAWLVEELGRDAALPSPESLACWAPKGLSPDLLAFLAPFAGGDDPAAALRGSDEADLPDVAHLGRLGLADGPSSEGVREGGAESWTGTGSESSRCPSPSKTERAPATGKGDRHLEGSEPVPFPSSHPSSHTRSEPETGSSTDG